MARNTTDAISGAVGNLVFYTMKGKNYIRTKPRKRKKKKGQAPDPRTTVFGIVSRYGTRMVKAMSRSFLFPFTLETYNQSRGWMRNQYAANGALEIWELEARRNMTCQLNTEADLRDFIETAITVTDAGKGLINIQIPPMNPAHDLQVPPGTKKVNMKWVAINSPFADVAQHRNQCMEQFAFDYNNSTLPAKTITLDTRMENAASANHIAIVVMALEFETAVTGTAIYNKETRYLPAAIVAMGRLKE